MGVWNRRITVGEVFYTGTFEVFNSNGAWSVLFRKPLLKTFKVVHNYDSDIVRITKGNDWTELRNQYHGKGGTKPLLPADCDPNMNQHINFKRNHCMSSLRQVLHNKNGSKPVNVAGSETALLPPSGQDPDTEKCTNLKGNHCTPPSRQVFQPNKVSMSQLRQ